MFPARPFAAAVTALALIAGACVAFGADAQDAGPTAGCKDAPGLAVLASPIAPWKGAPLRVVFTTEKPLEGELSLIAPDGRSRPLARAARRPAVFLVCRSARPPRGRGTRSLRASARRPMQHNHRDIAVRRPPAGAARTTRSVWPVRDTWNRATENLYSAWIEKLFDAPIEEQRSWPALHEVLRDPSRNFLFNHLSLREDQQRLVIRPDCADLPYFLRAYFAFKIGLPFGYAKCSRGGGGKAPQCPAWWNIQKEEPPPPPPDQTCCGGGGVLFGMFDAGSGAPEPPFPPQPRGSCRDSALICARSSPTACIPGSGRTAATTTTPITTPCR